MKVRIRLSMPKFLGLFWPQNKAARLVPEKEGKMSVVIKGGTVTPELQKRIDWVRSAVPGFPGEGRWRTYVNPDTLTGREFTFNEVSFEMSNQVVVVMDARQVLEFPHHLYNAAKIAMGDLSPNSRFYSEEPIPTKPSDLHYFGARTEDNDFHFGKVTYSAQNMDGSGIQYGEEKQGPGGVAYVLRRTVGMFGGGPVWVAK